MGLARSPDADADLPPKKRRSDAAAAADAGGAKRACPLPGGERLNQLNQLGALLAKPRWTPGDEAFLAEHSHALENLVSANAECVVPVLKTLVAAFRSVQVKGTSPALVSVRFDYIHSILKAILHLIPSAPSLLTHIIAENFPHKSEGVEENMWYLKNTMRIVTYAPVLQNCVWLLAIDKIVQIDVEIQTSLDDLDEEEYDSVLQHCFDFDGADLDSPDLLASPNTFVGAGKAASLGSNNNVDIDVDFELSMDALYDSDRESDAGSSTSSESDSEDEEDSDDEDGGPPPLIISDFREMAGKLDSLLQYLMHQISAVHETASSTKDELFLESFFQMLLLGFERTVLPTHKCRYAQFLFFKACSLSPKWCEAFLVFLAQKSFDAGTPSIIRVAAISYLSSFISRAAFLDTPSLLQCLRLLTAWALQYVEANETAKTYPDLKKDHVFYSVVQAILYIFCFRWQEIVGATQGQLHGQLPVEMTGFQKIVMSKFAPLQICARSIVTEFARITHKLDILYCYNLMNKKSSASAATAPATSTKPSATATTSTASISDSVSKDEPPQEQCYFITTETLDAFFPFDPCNLPMSRKAIQAFYAEWKEESEDNELHQPGSDLHAQRLLSQIGSFGSDISDALSASLDHILSFASPPRGIY